MRRPTRQRVSPTTQRHPALDYRPPAYLTALKWGGIGTAVLALAIAAYVGFWFYAAGELRDGTLAWIEARQSEGMTVKYARLDIGGFPFALRLHVEEPAIAAPSAPTPWGWEGQALQAEMRPWSPHRFAVRAAGEQGLVLTIDGEPHVYRGQTGRAAGEFRYGGNRLRAATIELADVKVTEAATGQKWTLDRATLDGDLPPSEDATHRTPVLDLRLHVAGLTLPDTIRMPLGNNLAELEIGATLLGPIAAGPPERQPGQVARRRRHRRRPAPERHIRPPDPERRRHPGPRR